MRRQRSAVHNNTLIFKLQKIVHLAKTLLHPYTIHNVTKHNKKKTVIIIFIKKKLRSSQYRCVRRRDSFSRLTRKRSVCDCKPILHFTITEEDTSRVSLVRARTQYRRAALSYYQRLSSAHLSVGTRRPGGKVASTTVTFSIPITHDVYGPFKPVYCITTRSRVFAPLLFLFENVALENYTKLSCRL